MEQFAIAEATGTEPGIGEKKMPKEIAVPDVLMHLVGHMDGVSANHDHDDPAPDSDYIVGGTGVVKALQYVLGEKANDMRRTSVTSGSATPRGDRPGSSAGFPPTEEQRGKAKKMSKNLLDSARKIRSRLQPALAKESAAGDELAYRRLLFLDQTLQSMIQRFEEEYPECRLAPTMESEPPNAPPVATIASNLADRRNGRADLSLSTQATEMFANAASDDEDADDTAPHLDGNDSGNSRRPETVKRHGSEVSLAGRALSLEEGRLHRLGQSLRRDIIDSPVTSGAPVFNSTHWEDDQARIKALGEKIETISGKELKDIVGTEGWGPVLGPLGANYGDLRKLQEQDPEGWEQFREAQLTARMNVNQDRPGSRGV